MAGNQQRLRTEAGGTYQPIAGGGHVLKKAHQTIRFSEDIYGFFLNSFCRDMSRLPRLEGTEYNQRLLRLVTSFVLLWANMGLQAYLLYSSSVFVTGASVMKMREVYDQYESMMYGTNASNYRLTRNGGTRGRPEFFDASMFDALSDEMKTEICQMPLSNVTFLTVVLLIHTLFCLKELRRTLELTKVMIADMPLPIYFQAQHRVSLDQSTEMFGRSIIVISCTNDQDTVLAIGQPEKIFICVCVLLPRFLISMATLWIGYRWLISTLSFQELFLNCCALSFILDLNSLMYRTMVSNHNKVETQRARMRLQQAGEQRLTLWNAMHTYLYGAGAVGVVYAYTHHWQVALRDYNWDIADVCAIWMDRTSNILER